MLLHHQPDRVRIAFDDHRLLANAGPIIPSTLPGVWACPNWSTTISTLAARRAGEYG